MIDMDKTLGIGSKKARTYGIILLLLIAAVIPWLFGLNLYILTLLVLMVIFIIYASSWNFLTYTGQGSLGHAAFFGLGGYASAIIASSSGLSPYITIFFGGAAAALVGLFIGAICVRLKEWFLAMVTFGFAIIIQTLMVSQFAGLSGGWDGIAAPRLIPATVPNYQLIEYLLNCSDRSLRYPALLFHSQIQDRPCFCRHQGKRGRSQGCGDRSGQVPALCLPGKRILLRCGRSTGDP